MAPADTARLEDRLVDLETRLAFQEQALAEMSDALAASQLEQTRTQDLLQRVLVDLRQLRTMAHVDAADEPPPPHW